MLSYPINNLAGGTVSAVTPGTKQSIRIHGVTVIAGGTTNFTLLGGGATGAWTGPYPLTAQTGLVMPVNSPDGWVDLLPGEVMQFTNSAAVQVSGNISYMLHGGN
jgi:hypothetical protein